MDPLRDGHPDAECFAELCNRNRPENSRLKPEKPEAGKTGSSQPEPPRKFPVEPGKTGSGKNRIFSTGTAQEIPG